MSDNTNTKLSSECTNAQLIKIGDLHSFCLVGVFTQVYKFHLMALALTCIDQEHQTGHSSERQRQIANIHFGDIS